MPVSTQTPINNYTGNASTVAFPFTFKILVQGDLKVYLDGVLQTTGYTVSGVGVDGGGSVTFTVAPAAGVVVRLQRIVTLERNTDYVEGGQLASDTLDNDFDRLEMQIQDLDYQAFKEGSDGALNATGRRMKNVADPIDAQDAATKNWSVTTGSSFVSASGTNATNASNSATASAASAASASSSATSATNSANAADISEANALSSETAAAASAVAAASSASAASTSETNSGASAGSASTSATNSAASASAAATSASNAAASETAAGASETTASAASAAALAALDAANLPAPTVALNMLRVDAGLTGYELRTASQVLTDIGGISAAVSNTFTKPQLASALALTHNTAWDGTDKQHLTVDVNGSSFTVANPSAQTAGVYYVLFIAYTTAHTLAFGDLFKGITDIVPTATAGAKDHFVFRSDGTNLHLVGSAYNVGA